MANQLKEYIYENDKVEFILEEIGCHNINSTYKKEFRCGLPSHSNKNSVSVKKEPSLKVAVYGSDDEIIRGDIFTLVMNIKEKNFPKSVEYLHKLLGLKYERYKSNKKEENNDSPLNIFKKMSSKSKGCKVDVSEIEFVDEHFISDYTPNLHESWIREGIISRTARRFNIGYDYDRKRIIIPHRYWQGDENDFIGVIGRTTLDDKLVDMLGVPKYFPMKAYPKNINLYGLNENYKSIQETGYVSVFEAEKSTLKRHSRLDETGVGVGSHSLSDEQVKILISLDVEVIICYDQDVSLEHIRSECEKFYGIRKCSYIYDKWGLLGKKDSPADLSNKLYQFMFKYRVRYDEGEHKEYIKSLK